MDLYFHAGFKLGTTGSVLSCAIYLTQNSKLPSILLNARTTSLLGLHHGAGLRADVQLG